MPPQASAYSSGAAISRRRTPRSSRRSSAPQAASSSTLTRPVRDAVSTTAPIASAKAARASHGFSRPICSSATVAMADQTSWLLRWLGWRRLPTARPGKPERAIQSGSGQPGAKTWIAATPTLRPPASSHPQQKAAKRSSREACARAVAPPTSSTAAAASMPSADSARLPGSAPGPQDQRAAAPTIASAPSGAQALRAAAPAQPATATNRPQAASARAWFRKVGDGAGL